MGTSIKKIVSLLLFFNSFFLLEAKDLLLVDNNRVNYEIILPNKSTDIEENAAIQLQKHLERLGNFNVAIKKENQQTLLKKIYLGKTKAYNNYFANSVSLDEVDEILIKSINDDIFINGNGSRGVLYAVYEFLEQFLKIQFFTPKDFQYPKLINNTLKISEPNLNYTPPFYYRSHYSYNALFNEEFACILKENGDFQPTNKYFGETTKILGWVHTFDQILPYKKYGKEHPNWFINSETEKHFDNYIEDFEGQLTQLDLQNSELRKTFLKNVFDWIKNNPNSNIISISQNDNRLFYTSDKNSSKTEELIEFINYIAKEVYKIYPSKKIETLAYYQTEEPPKNIKPLSNVIIRFAPIDGDMGYAIYNVKNSQIKSNIENWRKVTNELFYWGYNTNFKFPILPYPSLNKTVKDLPYLAENKFKGIFIQDNTNPSEGYGYFQDMQTWVIAKLMWNPKLDSEELIKEFFDGFYKESSKPLYGYYKLIESNFFNSKFKLNAFEDNYHYLNNDNLIIKAENYFQEAENLATTHELKTRIRKEKFSLEFLKIYLGKKSQEDTKEFFNNLYQINYENPYVNNALKSYLNDIILSFANIANTSLTKKENTNKRITLQEDTFIFYRKGDLTNLEADLNASNLLCASIFGKTQDWNIQIPLDKRINFIEEIKNIDVILKLKSIEENHQLMDDSSTIVIGFFDSKLKQVIKEKTIKINNLESDKFFPIKIKDIKLNKETIVYIVFNNNREKYDKLLVDKIIIN